jgi:plastocyanin
MQRALIAITALGIAVMPATALAKTEKVDAFDFGFDPGTAKIDKGDKVKWKSTDGDHDVTFKSGIDFAEDIDEGESVSHKFNETGTFKYICKIHKSQGMKGKVKVK